MASNVESIVSPLTNELLLKPTIIPFVPILPIEVPSTVFASPSLIKLVWLRSIVSFSVDVSDNPGCNQ